MRIAVILLSVLVLMGLVGDVDAKKRKSRNTLIVHDYTSPPWDGVVSQTVNEFNAVMPKRGPRLIYTRHEAASCDIGHARVRKTVKVCSLPEMNAAGRAHTRQQVILLNDTYTGDWYDQFRAMTVCHEFMHILTHVVDNNSYDPVTGITTWPLPYESCVWGVLNQPGPFDVDLLRQRYGKKH